MNLIKKCIFSILTITLFLILTVINVFADSYFSDVPETHWAYKYIMQMVKEGAVDGYEDGSFKPENPVTRAEFCKITIMASGKTVPTLDEVRGAWKPVPNIEGHWAECYLNAMAKNTWGYQEWYLSNDVKPDVTINRGEAAMGISDVWYTYARSYIESNAKSYLADKYKDADTFGGFWGSIYEATKEGFMNGYEDGCFYPGKAVTRAELCTILYKAFSKDLEDNLSDTTDMEYKHLKSIILHMNKDYYFLYRTANNRIQKINGVPYLSNDDLQLRLSTDFGDHIIDEALSELKRTTPSWESYPKNIIYFVQHDIEYLNDTDERDYAKFPYETLYDAGGDCEDKAILLCSLLNKAGYDVCLIVFSDHVGIGVAMENDIDNGYYFSEKNGTKYYYLETTSYGWDIGELPEDYIYETATLLFPQ